MNNLQRFLKAQEHSYQTALEEIRNGRKENHWMWFIFPQIAGLGRSDMARYYAIKDMQEAKDYLEHPILGKRLIEISEVLLKVEDKSAKEILGTVDEMKLRSSMTLFSSIKNTNDVFAQVLQKYFKGIPDQVTLQVIGGLALL